MRAMSFSKPKQSGILTQNSEVPDKRLDFWGKELAAGGTSEDVGGSQVHQTDLAEGVPAE